MEKIMKKFLSIFLFTFILFAFQKVYAGVNDPIIKYFTPLDGTLLMISESETGRYVDIYFEIDNLCSSSAPWGWYGYEIWVLIDGNVIFNYKDNSKVSGKKNYGPTTLPYQWFNVGSHTITINAKSYVYELFWVDTYKVGETHHITIKHPFTANLSRAFEFDQTEALPSQHSSSGDPIQISVSTTYTHPSGRQYVFGGWSDGNTLNPRTVTDNLTVSALYKVIHKSNDATAFSNNSQRKLIETKSGSTTWLHQVYTNSINGVSHVWLEHSSDGGSTWILGNNGLLDNGSGGKNPSIAYTHNSDYNYIGVVWQQPSGSHYAICGKIFNQYIGSSDIPHPMDEASYTIFTEPSDAYSVNANPNLVLTAGAFGPFFITYERKSTSGSLQPGVNWVVGHIRDIALGGWDGPFGSIESNGIISGTNASSIDIQMSPYPDYNNSNDVSVNLLRQQGSPGTIYSHFLYLTNANGYWEYSQYDDGMISYNSNVNFSPSIVSLNDYVYSACWIEYTDMAFYFYDNHIRYYFGSSGSGAVSCSINRGGGNSNSGSAAWSIGGTNRSIRFDNGIPVTSSIRNLSTTGRYVQVGDGAGTDLSNMRVSSFYPSTSPYYFNTSGALTPLSKSNSEITEGRGFIINKGDESFSYSVGDLSVDGSNIIFADVSDTADYGNINTLNGALITEPFQLNANSKVYFSEHSGFADSSSAIKALGKSDFIHYKVELIDNASEKVIGTIKDINLTSSNTYSLKDKYYLLDTKGISGKEVRAKITVETNLVTTEDSLDQSSIEFLQNGKIPAAVRNARKKSHHSNLILTKTLKEKNENIAKAAVEKLALQEVNILKTFALTQNYPNPFNPTTTISYQLPKDGVVTLKIYDVLGREVTTIINNEFKTTGRYNVKFNAGNLASGVYIYRLNITSITGENFYTATKKLMLLK